jgi:carbamate kinase
MRPKVEAACRFVRDTGRDAAIGSLQDAAAIVAGDAGTRISLLAGAIELDGDGR